MQIFISYLAGVLKMWQPLMSPAFASYACFVTSAYAPVMHCGAISIVDRDGKQPTVNIYAST